MINLSIIENSAKISQLLKNDPLDIFKFEPTDIFHTIVNSIKGVNDPTTFLPSLSSSTFLHRFLPVGPPGGTPGRPESPEWTCAKGTRGQCLKSFTFWALISPGSNDGSGEANLLAVVIQLVPELEASSTSCCGVFVPGKPGNPLRVAGSQFICLDGMTSIRTLCWSLKYTEESLLPCCALKCF